MTAVTARNQNNELFCTVHMLFRLKTSQWPTDLWQRL